MKLIKYFITLSLITVLVLPPNNSFAQTASPNATSGGAYNPSSTAGNGKTFSGMSFSGVGGAIAGCTNAGGALVGGISGLFNKGSGSDSINQNSNSSGGIPHGSTPSSGGQSDPGSGARSGSSGSSGIGGQSVPTADSAVGTNTANSVKEEKTANHITQCLNGIAYAAAKSLLQQLSNKTLNWINTGMGGNPFYVQDIGSSLKSIRDQELQSTLNSIQTSDPIFGNALRSTITQQTTGLTDGYLNKVMNTPEAKQYQAFQSDFTQGGWFALLNPNYNPVGALFNTSDQLAKTINSQQQNLVNEIQRNNGFLDMKTCVEYEKPANASTPTGLDALYPTECEGKLSGERPSWCETYTATPISNATQPIGTTPKCLTWKTVTPGSIISSQASSILGSSQKQLELANSINQVLGAFFDQLINGLLQNGLNSLQGGGNSSNNNFGGLASNVVLGSNGLPISNNGGTNTLGYQATGRGGYSVQEFDISRPQQLRSIIETQYNFLNRSQDSQIVLEKILPTLGALDYCIPGPNPTWQDGLNNNFQSFLSVFQTPSQDRTLAGKFLSAATNPVIKFVVSLFGGGGNTKVLNYALVGEPVLYDKVTNSGLDIGAWDYYYYTKDYARGVVNTDGNWIRNWITDGFNRVITKYQTNFTTDKIINLFTANSTDPAQARTNVKESLKETAKLVSYSQNLGPLDANYTESISNKKDAIVELEDIRQQELQIVKTAKARYIAEQAAAGTPVNLTCLNNAYVIDETPIVPVARQESSSTTDPMLQKAIESNKYFYNNL